MAEITRPGRTNSNEFYEEDEPVQNVVMAFERGEKHVTRKLAKEYGVAVPPAEGGNRTKRHAGVEAIAEVAKEQEEQ